MIGMGKKQSSPRNTQQKELARLMESIEGKYSKWEIWQDFIIMMAVSIANTFPGPHRAQREKLYQDHAAKYQAKELDVFAHMAAEVVSALEHNPEQDVLGELFMLLGLSNEWKGQFFTPYNVCRAMAMMTFGPSLKDSLAEKGWFSVNDPACGAGATLIAMANECRRQGINYQTSVLFVAQDIDFLASCMCYIQLSLLGCAGYIVVDDSIMHPAQSYDDRALLPASSQNVWMTPMYYRDVWEERRQLAFLSSIRNQNAC